MVDPLVMVLIDIELGAKRPLVDLLLGALVDEGALHPGKRRFVPVIFEKILTDFGADCLKDEPQVADDRVVAQDRMSCLEKIVNAGQRQSRTRNGQIPPDRIALEREHACRKGHGGRYPKRCVTWKHCWHDGQESQSGINRMRGTKLADSRPLS